MTLPEITFYKMFIGYIANIFKTIKIKKCTCQ